MNDEKTFSRRDWFRLRASVPGNANNPNPSGQAMGNRSPSLQPVPHPANHDGMDLSELPPMREALLSHEQTRQLFADLEALAADVFLMQRSTGAQRATASRATTPEQLAVARDSLLSGAIPRIQIRYRWQETKWIDTLEKRDGGFRLVRIAHATDVPPA